jgi:hypothetical protein
MDILKSEIQRKRKELEDKQLLVSFCSTLLRSEDSRTKEITRKQCSNMYFFHIRKTIDEHNRKLP